MKTSKARRDYEVIMHKWAAVLGTSEGRWAMGEIMKYAGLYEANRNNDIAEIARQEGRREIGLFIYHSIVEFCPNAFIQMIVDENKNLQAALNEKPQEEEER